MKNQIIFSELVNHGATKEQANGYLRLLHQFEKESKNRGEKHHILPRNVGWWKKYGKAKWNSTQVDWPLHLALHAYLVKLFPENDSLGSSLQIISTRKTKDAKGLLKNKAKIEKWYISGVGINEIARRLKVTPAVIRQRMENWGIKRRPNGETQSFHTNKKMEENKEKIIALYKSGMSAKELGKKFGVNQQTLTDKYFHKWGVKLISVGHRVSLRRRNYLSNVVEWCKAGKSLSWIENKGRAFWKPTALERS